MLLNLLTAAHEQILQELALFLTGFAVVSKSCYRIFASRRDGLASSMDQYCNALPASLDWQQVIQGSEVREYGTGSAAHVCGGKQLAPPW